MTGREYLIHSGRGVASGAAAVVTSAPINQIVLDTAGRYVAVGFVAPIVEELTKNGFALVSQGNTLLSHSTFGSVEGFLYAKRIGENRMFDHARPLLHAAYGVLFLVGSAFGRRPLQGFLTAMLGHVIWNHYSLWREGMLPFQTRRMEGQMALMSVADTEEEIDQWAEVKKRILI